MESLYFFAFIAVNELFGGVNDSITDKDNMRVIELKLGEKLNLFYELIELLCIL